MSRPDEPALPVVPQPPAPTDPTTETVETVEALVRRRLADALGGWRGVVEAAVPTLTFTLGWVTTRELRGSLTAAVAAAVLLLVVRLAQRQTPQFVVNSLFGIGIAAVFALRSGEAQDAFLPGILYNAVYAVVLIVSVVTRWPVVGFLIGSVTGDPTGWRDDRAVVRLCQRLTLLLALPCIARVVVQYPLYLAELVGWLGVTKVLMGWPLQLGALAAMGWVLTRGRTPVNQRA